MHETSSDDERILPHKGRPPTRLELATERIAASRPGCWAIRTFIRPVDRWMLRRTQGKRAMFSSTIPMLMLLTTGARSGEPRETPLVFMRDGADIVLVASNYGGERHPAWYHNLVAHPDAEVLLDGKRQSVRAREVTGDERDRLWELAHDTYRGYDTYTERAGQRTIPVIVLEPRRS